MSLIPNCQKKLPAKARIRSGCFLKNKNTKCPIDAHCHRHCIAEKIQGLQGIALVSEPSRGLFELSAPHEPIFFEDLLRPKITRSQT